MEGAGVEDGVLVCQEWGAWEVGGNENKLWFGGRRV